MGRGVEMLDCLWTRRGRDELRAASGVVGGVERSSAGGGVFDGQTQGELVVSGSASLSDINMG
jgi:hypothetical protein